MMIPRLLPALLCALLLVDASSAARPRGQAGARAPPSIADDPGEQIPGPANPSDPAGVQAWRATLVDWRARMRAKIGYNGSIFDVPELKWTQTSYIQPQMHPYAAAQLRRQRERRGWVETCMGG